MPNTKLKLPGTAISNSEISVYSAVEILAPIYYQTVHIREANKFDLMIADDVEVKNGLIETGRSMKKIPDSSITKTSDVVQCAMSATTVGHDFMSYIDSEH